MRWCGGGVGLLGRRIGIILLLLVAGCGRTLTQVSSRAQEGIQAQQAYATGMDRYTAKAYAGTIPES